MTPANRVSPTPGLPPALVGSLAYLPGDGPPIAYYADRPAGTLDGARPLLLIHSVNAAASAAEVRPLYEHYRSRRPVYAIDLPGYGLSDRSDRVYSLRLMTDAVHALTTEIADRHGATPIDAIAVSLASEFLARAASERPDAYRTVGLVSATGLNRDKPFDGPPGSTRGQAWLLSWLGRSRWSPALFRLLTRPGVIRFFLQKTWGSKEIDEALYEYDVLTTRVDGARRAPFYFLSAYLFAADITRVYEAVVPPVWLVHGTRGDFTDYRAAPRLATARGWTVDVMATGAMPYFEDLPGFVAAYERFVAGHA